MTSSEEHQFGGVMPIDRDLVNTCLPISVFVVVNVPHSEDIHLHEPVHAIQIMVHESWLHVATVVDELHPPLTVCAARHGVTVHSVGAANAHEGQANPCQRVLVAKVNTPDIRD